MKAIIDSKSAISKKGKIKTLEESKWIVILGRQIFLPSSALIPSINRAKKKGAKILLIDNKPIKSTPKIVDYAIKLDEKQTIKLLNKIKISKEAEKIISIIDSSKGCIILDPGFSPNPENLMPEIMNLLIKSGNPDLIILDIQLPEMSGIDICKKLKELKKFKDIPMIAVTSFAMKGDKDRILSAGFSEYISKPINVNEFRELVKDYLK